MENIQLIKKLTNKLNEACNAYYNLSKPIMTDKQYDKLFDKLKQLEIENNYILSNSPTQRAGYEVKSKLEKFTHKTPLRSLDKTKDIKELKSFINNKISDSLAMLKKDGLTVELEYNNGKFISASTRGNGEIGENITHNAKTFKNIPLEIQPKSKIRLVGEAIILKNDFEEINSKLSDEEKYKTPRNLTSGSVRQLDSKICKERGIYFYAFGLLEIEDISIDTDFKPEQINLDFKTEQLDLLKLCGFEVVKYAYIDKNINEKELQEKINQLKEYADKNYFPIDGIVVQYNNLEYGESLGSTSHHPLHSLAFKFKDEAEETILKEIEWSIGRTGVITPVAIFNPVEIDGTEVTRASLHNLSIIEDLELGMGDNITVIKCNMIIPQIEENLTRSNNIIIPDKCPNCGCKTEIKQIKDSKVLICTNDACSAKTLKKFCHFVSRDAMNIEGLSEATLDKFIDLGYLNVFSDIYKLQEHKQEIVKLDGFGLKSYNNLIQAIEKSKEVELFSFIYSLGINQVGLSGAKLLAKKFDNDIVKLINLILTTNSFKTKLLQIEGFGDIIVNLICNYFSNKDNLVELRKLINIVKFKENKNTSDNTDKLKDKILVITGDLKFHTNRKEIQQKIENLGGKVASSVSNKTTFLINNDSKSNSSKNKTAKELGVKIITEEEFLDMIK